MEWKLSERVRVCKSVRQGERLRDMKRKKDIHIERKRVVEREK